MDALEGDGLETELVRVVDHDVKPGVSSDEGDGDEWPAIGAKPLAAEILVFATPTWLTAGGPGDSYLDSDDGREWSHETGRAAASNLAAVARALAERPVPPPP